MIAVFDEDGGGDVDFKEFIRALSIFSSKGNKEEKLKCKKRTILETFLFHNFMLFKACVLLFIVAFKVYDINGDGFISSPELFSVLKMMVGKKKLDIVPCFG